MPADGSHSASATARTTAPQTDSPSSAMTGNSSSNILSNASKNSPLLSPNKQLTAYYPHSLLRLIHSVVVYIVLYYTIYFGACPLEGEGVVARQRREFNRGASRRKPGGNRPLPHSRPRRAAPKPRLLISSASFPAPSHPLPDSPRSPFRAIWRTGASGLKNCLTGLTLPRLLSRVCSHGPCRSRRCGIPSLKPRLRASGEQVHQA